MENMTLEQQIAALRAENERLRQQKDPSNKPSGSLKVSAKGAISVYGLGRFPVTLYMSQWQALLGRGEEIKAFIQANAPLLATKAEG